MIDERVASDGIFNTTHRWDAEEGRVPASICLQEWLSLIATLSHLGKVNPLLQKPLFEEFVLVRILLHWRRNALGQVDSSFCSCPKIR